MEQIQYTLLEGAQEWNSVLTSTGRGAAPWSVFWPYFPVVLILPQTEGDGNRDGFLPKGQLGSIVSTSHPCSCQGKDNMPAEKLLTCFSDQVPGPLEAENQGARWFYSFSVHL